MTTAALPAPEPWPTEAEGATKPSRPRSPKPEGPPLKAIREGRVPAAEPAQVTSLIFTAPAVGNLRVSRLEMVGLDVLVESPHNPRHAFDTAKLQELADSIAKVGILTPLTVRPSPGGRFEIAAGHRRYRAAKLAGLEFVPVFVRDLDDAAFLELLTLENLQRDDLHPLEEADGYQQLMTASGADVATIAAKVGRSVAYVYDRLKLLRLTRAAKARFAAGEFTTGHAVLLARLTPEAQARALEDGMFEHEDINAPGLDFKHLPQKPRSVRELAQWIDDEVRFDPTDVDPVLFPVTAEVLRARTAEASTVVHITREHQVPEFARDATQRTYGPSAWKRADGQPDVEYFTGRKTKSKRCDHAVLGVVVVGPGRGEAFDVCVAKKQCQVHWPTETKTPGDGGSRKDEWKEESRKSEERWAKERAKRDAEDRAWKAAQPAVLDLVADAIRKLPVTTGAVADHLLDQRRARPKSGKDARVKRGTSAEDLLRHLCYLRLEDEAGQWGAAQAFPKLAKRFGVNIKSVLDQLTPAPAKPVPTKTKARKAARK